MLETRSTILILVAEDDEDDRLLVKDAFAEAKLTNPLHFVEDGEMLMDYLHRRNGYADLAIKNLPGLILLDLNMPRKNGIEALREIKSNPELRRIPVIVFTTSKTEEDIVRSYNLGVNSFITKPVKFENLVDLMKNLSRYWFEIVELPS